MKLNKKGFTLIELLAVVVILLAISVIAIPSISSAIERNKAKQNNTKKEIIVSYAKLYYEEHKNSFVNPSGSIGLGELKLSDTERVDANGNAFVGVVCYYTETSGVKFKYEDDGDCNN